MRKIRGGLPPLRAVAAAAAAVAAAMSVPAHAVDIATDVPGLSMDWENTFKYSAIDRLHNPDATQLGNFLFSPSGDGDRNFGKGIVSNRVDWLTEFNVVKDQNFGARVSAAAYYDTAYERGNANNTAITHNISVPANQFTAGTQDAVGNGSQLLDAFIFKKGDLGDMPGTIRLGRHTVVYGETLLDGSNGIAAAQGPVDIVKAATVPGAQVKEFLLPTNQVSFDLQPSEAVSVGAYYQLQWEKSNFFPAGSFLSPNDISGPGAESFLSTPAGGLFTRGPDLQPKNGGQWGAELHFTPQGSDVDYGFYAANYHDKTASAVYFDPVAGTFQQVYQENIRTYGASASTVLGSDNVSIEGSTRLNEPLTGGADPGPSTFGYVIATPGGGYNNSSNPAYAVGHTAHMTLVDIHLFQPGGLLKDGGSVVTQLDWHDVLDVTKNPQAVDPTATKSAAKITVAFNADYFQVMDGLDLSVPIVLSRSLYGRSAVYVGWVDHGGSLDLGLNFKYLTNWKAGIDYHHFMGPHGVNIGNGAFDQTQWDRDYVSFNISTSI